MKKNHLLIFAFAILFSISSYGQKIKQAPDQEKFTTSELKKIEKSKQLYRNNKIPKAIAMLDPIQQTHLLNEELWSIRVQYEYDNYLQNVDHYTGKHPNYLLPPGAEVKAQFLGICEQATLYCKGQEHASMYLRVLLVDEKVDKYVSDDAKDEFNDAEVAFSNGKYESAVKHYKNAYALDTNYYKAALYIGDAYFGDKEYELALPWYQKGVKMHPELLEGHKYLTDVYMKLFKWKEAYEACINGIICYPDVGMFLKMEKICDGLDKKFDRNWMPRFNLPNKVGENQDSNLEEPWNYYRLAKNSGEAEFNRYGIQYGKDSVITCFETYSWRQMLSQDKNNSADLVTARKMEEAGYLDCYVMVSLFHNSFYKQYRDFSKVNGDRIRKYFELYLVKPL